MGEPHLDIPELVHHRPLPHEALALVEAEMAALRRDELLVLNVDVFRAVSRTLAASRKIRALRPRMARLPEFDLEAVDKLELYALALESASARVRVAVAPHDGLDETVREAKALRRQMAADVAALVCHGVIPATASDCLQGARRYLSLAEDLQVLALLFEEHWAQIGGRCGTTEAHIARAATLSTRLYELLGARKFRDKPGTAPAEARQRVFTLFFRAYKEAQRGVAFLRAKEGDAELILPSIFARRVSKRAIETPLDRTHETPATAEAALPVAAEDAGQR